MRRAGESERLLTKAPLTRCDRERVVLKPMKIALAIAALGKRLV